MHAPLVPTVRPSARTPRPAAPLVHAARIDMLECPREGIRGKRRCRRGMGASKRHSREMRRRSRQVFKPGRVAAIRYSEPALLVALGGRVCLRGVLVPLWDVRLCVRERLERCVGFASVERSSRDIEFESPSAVGHAVCIESALHGRRGSFSLVAIDERPSGAGESHVRGSDDVLCERRDIASAGDVLHAAVQATSRGHDPARHCCHLDRENPLQQAMHTRHRSHSPVFCFFAADMPEEP